VAFVEPHFINPAIYLATAEGDHSIAMDFGTTANGYTSIAMGSHTTASADYSTAIGRGWGINNKLTNTI